MAKWTIKYFSMFNEYFFQQCSYAGSVKGEGKLTPLDLISSGSKYFKSQAIQFIFFLYWNWLKTLTDR